MLKRHIEAILGRTCYSPDDVIDAPGDLDILDAEDKDDKTDKTDDDKKDEEDTEEGDTDDDEDKKDEDEEEEDDKDDEEKDEEEDTEEDLLPSVKDIKKDYPDFFKKHPEVKAAIFRDQRFSEVIGTPEEAEAAVARSNVLAEVEKDLYVDANPERLLSHMKKTNEDSYKKIVFNMIGYLQEKDRDLYLEVGALPIKQLLRNAFREGDGEKGNLGKAALWIHQYMFGKGANLEDKVTAEQDRKSGKTQEQKDYEERLSKLEQKEYNGFKDSVDQSYVTRMDKFIREGLEKDDRLTEWMRTKIVNDTLEQIVEQLNNDTRHGTAMNSLWRNAKAAGFNNDFKSRIINAALARAKSLAPSIRATLVNEALGKVKKKDSKNTDKQDKKVESKQREFRREDRSSRRSTEKNTKPLTDLDILRS